MRLVRVDSSRVVQAEEAGAVDRQESSVAAALAPAGWVTLLEVHTSVPAWSTCSILGLVLGKLLSCEAEKEKCICVGAQHSQIHIRRFLPIYQLSENVLRASTSQGHPEYQRGKEKFSSFVQDQSH